MEPILLIKVTVTISTMLNFNGPNFGVGMCEQALALPSNARLCQ